MFSSALIQHIESEIRQTSSRILPMEVAGETLIIKRQEAARPLFGYTVLNALAKIFQQPLLCAVPAPGGAAAQAIEIYRLNSLREAGVPVPEVRHIAPTWFAMTVAGTHSLDELIRDPNNEHLEVWRLGLAAILQVHQCGQNLSQAFARNIIWDAGQIRFIDFEDDPIKTLPLAYAQCRDWLLYLHSMAYQINVDAVTLAETWQSDLTQESREVQDLIRNCSQQLAWVRHLPTQRKPWGRDVISLQGAGRVLHALNHINR
ncbi:MAG: hypothetical protein ACRC6G_12615 [Deefgea sp.]